MGQCWSLKRARIFAIALLLAIGFVRMSRAAELKPATIDAFERYRRIAEATIEQDASSPDRFLHVFHGDAAARAKADGLLRRGEVVVDRLRATDNGRRIEVPDGLIHHWIGSIFVPDVPLRTAVAVLQDFDQHADLFRPNIQRSKILEHDSDRFRITLRFYMKKIVAVTVDTESLVEFTPRGPDRETSAIRSVRVNEIEAAGTPEERQKPDGHGGGYMWRMNTYWRFLERDGGTYIECEALTLSRSIPTGLGWLIGPVVASIPRDMLTSALQATRRSLVARSTADRVPPHASN
ncbi:MAG TPA: hypothetical protein VF456_19365 [Vicinamibacterales bacterium]